MTHSYDIIVAGLGAHGSAALYQLSKSGSKILGIDRYQPPHTFGSSHGQSRIIRQAYYEHPMYVPLVKKAYALWHELENATGEQLLLKTGGIMLGAVNTNLITGAKASAEKHGLAYDYLHHDEIKKRFPAFITDDETVAVVEKDAGILFPEKCVKAYLQQAKINGADIAYNEKINLINHSNKEIKITTDKSSYSTKKLVITLGAWLNDLLPELQLPLTIERQVLFWFKNTNTQFQNNLSPDALPVFIWEYEKDKMFYGFPDLGDGIKIAFHHAGKKILPDTLKNETATQKEIDDILHVAVKYLSVDPVFNYAEACMYTNTPDEHFIIDHHPSNENIVIASPCSGHGFKFASWVGKIIADMILNDKIPPEISPFRIDRFL